jgi:hypothetical protein
MEKGTDKLNRGRGLALHKLVSRAQKHFAMSHFESCLHGLSTLKLHISSKNKLTCQYRQSRVARSLHNKNNYALIFSKSHAVI